MNLSFGCKVVILCIACGVSCSKFSGTHIFQTLRSALRGRDFDVQPLAPHEYLVFLDKSKLVLKKTDGSEIALSLSGKGLTVQSSNRRKGGGNCGSLSVCHGLYGIYELPAGCFVAIIKESQSCANLFGCDLRRVIKCDLLKIPSSRPLQDTKYNATTLAERQEAAETVLRNALRQHALYFTVNGSYDLTRTWQSNVMAGPGAPPDERFYWNLNCLRPVLEHNCSKFAIPVVNAWISSVNITHEGVQYRYTLVSRRSRRRQGPR